MPFDCLTSFIAAATPDDISASVQARAARVLADTMAAIAAGMQEPEMRRLAPMTAFGGPATVLGSTLRAEASGAAFLNGAAGVFLEIDEGAARAKGHPAIHVVPPLLAWAEQTPGDGRRLIRALTLGYEVAVRCGAAATLRPEMHPHGTWGVLGGAAALAAWDGADAADLANTLRIAASLALATSRPTMLEGATVRNAYSGLSGQHAVQARRMASAGFTGDRNALAVVFGAVIGSAWDEDALTAGLGDGWAIADGYFKRHACCRFNHAALDALADLRAGHPGAITAESTAAIEVATYGLAAELDDPAPANMLAAKFSLPFALATSIRRDGDTWLDAFRDDARADTATRGLAAKVRLTIDPEFDAAAPAIRASRVTVVTNSGQRLTAERRHADGDPETPFDALALDEKFLRLTAPILSEGRALRALTLALNTPGGVNVADLTRAFAQPERLSR